MCKMVSGHVITDDIVIDYKKSDKDDALHFLTHVDVKPNQPLKSLSEYISPTANRILTSNFNAWFLEANYGVKNCVGYSVNTKIKVIFKGIKYICYFLDAKYSAGSISVLIWGPFGTCLYTGNFCFYPNYFTAPLLSSIVQRKRLLTTLYLDASYYEQKSEFCGIKENLEKTLGIIKSETKKRIYIYAEQLTLDPIIADLASQLEENVYIDQSRMETMKLQGYEKYFTTDINRSRIFISKGYLQKRGTQDIVIIFHHHPEPTLTFESFSVNKTKSIFNFHFYCHSNHKDCCRLINVLKPERLILMHSSSIDRSKITIAPVLNSLGKNKIFSVSSSFKSIQPPNSIPKTSQSNVTEVNINRFSPKKQEMHLQEVSGNSTIHSTPFLRKLYQNIDGENSTKFEKKYLQEQRGYEKYDPSSKICDKQDVTKSAFTIPQINVREPLKTPPDSLYKIETIGPVIAATFSLNSQKSFGKNPNHSLKGATEFHLEQHDFKNQEKNKNSCSADHFVESNQQECSARNSQELLKEGRLKIRKVSEINLLSKVTKRILVPEKEMGFVDESNADETYSRGFDCRKTSNVQEESKNCITKDSSLLSLLKACEKPKSILIAKPLINKSCVYHVKNNDLNGKSMSLVSPLNVESDLHKNHNLQQSRRKPIWANRPLYIYEDKKIIPVKHQISLLAKNNTDSFVSCNELSSSVNKEMYGKLNCNSKHDVTKIISFRSVNKVSESVNKEMEQRGSPDVFNHIINNRYSQNPSKPIGNFKEISYTKDSSISSPINTNSFIGNELETLSRLPVKNINVVAMPLNNCNNSQESDIVIQKCLQIAANSSKKNINNSEHISYLEESKHQKQTLGNSNNNRWKSISIPENSLQEEGNFENLITSLEEQIKTSKEYNQQSKISKIPFEPHCELSQSKNKLVNHLSENLSIQSNVSFSMKDIFSTNTCDSESSKDKDDSANLTSSKDKECPSTLQLKEGIAHKVNLNTLSLSTEPPVVYKNQKRKISSSQNVSHKKMRCLRSARTDFKETQLMDKSVDECSKNNSESGSKIGTSLNNTLDISTNANEPLQNKFQIKQCKVLLDRKEILRRHFFSSTHGTYMPKFHGFTKNEIKTRRTLYFLRIYNKVIPSVKV